MPDLRPNLYRVAVTSLVLAGLANVLLWRVSGVDDTFANIIAVTSGVSAVAIVGSAFLAPLARWREEALLLAFATWTANVIEFALEDDASWESRTRLCGFYAAFAILALGVFIGLRVEQEA